jgi:hypothetical protein
VSGVNETLAHPDRSTGAARAARASRASPGTQIPQPAGFRVAPPCGKYYNDTIDTLLPPYGDGYPSDPPLAVCGYTGPQFRSGYGLTSADDGTGVTVAIVDAYESPTLFSDARELTSLNDPSNRLQSSQFSELKTHGFNKTTLCAPPGRHFFGIVARDGSGPATANH